MAPRATDRRSFLKYAGATAAAASLAGCGGGGTDGGGGDGGDTTTETTTETTTTRAEPETRQEYLQRANLLLHEEAPWIFLNRQYSVYGVNTEVEWQARRDERIDAYEMTPEGSKSRIRITQSEMDSGLDPHDHRETPTDNIVVQCYEGLLSRDPGGAIRQQLATGYERVEEGTARFELRSGVSFHSGDPLTPEDVAFSINRIVDSEVGFESPQSDQLAGVTGAEPADGGGAVIVDNDGLNPIVFSQFATYCDVMNKSWVQANNEDENRPYINSHMNGTGPFQLEEYESGVQVTYSSYDDYYMDAAPADELVIRAAGESSTRVSQLLSGESDVVVNVPPQDATRVQNDEGTRVAAVPSTRVIYNAMIYDTEPFDSVAFRRAMNYAVDLESIIDNILGGFADPTGQPTLEGFTGYNDEVAPYPHDPDRAESLVEESGYGGAEIELHTPNGRYLKDFEIAQAVVEQIDQLENVTATVNQREFGTLAGELLDGDLETSPDWYLIGWGNATFDASQTIIPLLTADGALTSYSNEEVDRLIEQAQSMPNA